MILKTPETLVMLGGEGCMAQLIQKHLPYRWHNIDIKSLQNRRNVRRAILSQVHSVSHEVGSGLRAIVLMNLPASVYREALRMPGHRAVSRNILGISGCGQSNTLFLHHSSVHAIPAKVLDAVSGPALGMHLMYGPHVRDLSRQTAVVTVSSQKQSHHLYKMAQRWVVDSLKSMGHGQVICISPEIHDQIMANIQFLTHSFFLIAADIVRRSVGTPVYQADIIPKLVKDVMGMSQRILSGDIHVYQGIALDNPSNAMLFKGWKSQLGSVREITLLETIMRLIRITRETSEMHFAEHGIDRRVQRIIRTPVSRVREGLFQTLNEMPIVDGNSSCLSAINASLSAYEIALGSPHAYAQWFQALQRFFPDRADNDSDKIICAYGL